MTSTVVSITDFAEFQKILDNFRNNKLSEFDKRVIIALIDEARQDIPSYYKIHVVYAENIHQKKYKKLLTIHILKHFSILQILIKLLC